MGLSPERACPAKVGQGGRKQAPVIAGGETGRVTFHVQQDSHCKPG
jgi:hypothetical protein